MKVFKKVWVWFEWSLVVSLAVLVFVLGYFKLSQAVGNPLPMIFGWGNAITISGSMEPEIPIGALLFIQQQGEYQPGKIVSYVDKDGKLVTHRLVFNNGEIAITKGDSNNIQDEEIRTSQILGQVKLVFPEIGLSLIWINKNLWLFVLIGFLLLFLYFYFKKRKGRKAYENHS